MEFFGPGVTHLSIADRATIANMCPEYGATVGFFPVDEKTLVYLRQTGEYASKETRWFLGVAEECDHQMTHYNLSPSYVADLFRLNNSGYNLRNSVFIIPRFNLVAYGKHSLHYLGPTIWAILDSYVKSFETLSITEKWIKYVNISSLINHDCDNCYLCEN